ncbi:uncharacterized protein A1O5_07226 [Cladophialophora psammophila CBS 110553]|uniref:polynucleotide adenylyltransferase n=1 Tax=Cladophialophora psammophila CBS 110553 TaxID=1182543 RepID=W9WVU8_9EURO|nr:uncharacterized protein A1O5_07226 [Cladophialophora psammophila CBS 110553]EXJ69190.1 hypothetical protein A1O5_07226 [Cladophialophora psammophila CBS 110553]
MHLTTEQQHRSIRHMVMMQSDYLNGVGRRAYDVHRFRQEEKDIKENFRQTLERVARQALGARYPDLEPDKVKLKCYGSLANGFALAGSDLDLLLSLPEYEGPKPEVNAMPTSQSEITSDDRQEGQGFKADIRRILEKAFLDHGYGARLLTQTRVPILRVCQSPTPELLRNLRQNRAAWDMSRDESGIIETDLPTSDDAPAEADSVQQALTDLSLAATAPAKQGRHGNAGLEFTEDCGIQCDINFANFVALHNSALLRTYQSFDSRVREVGIFVKIWAKARDINTPYRGTLSSYGWIMMVLHYLMNVVNPPVIPNLQYLAKIDDSWYPDRPIELFEGFDVRFVQDSKGLKEAQEDVAANRNKESAGQLLRGFFQYYATYQGFHWTRDVISIRTKGGLISKQAKGWTEAKWQQTGKTSVRLRYLLAIEDPFEIEHNVARTVGHHGIIAIRDEFRRAWSIINTIGTDQEIPAGEFLTPVTERVDTLKKDLEGRKERQMQLRQELEAKEKALLRKGDEETPDPYTDGTLGDSDLGKSETHLPQESKVYPSKSKLTSTTYPQDRNRRVKPKRWRYRKVSVDSDDGEEDENSINDARDNAKEHDSTHNAAPQTKAEPKEWNEGLTSRSEVLFANGYDLEGNPIAWDIDTRDGRWLAWRDRKVKKGTLKEFANPNLSKLNEECPYDARRPNPYIGKPYRNNFEHLMQNPRAPWPSSNRGRGNRSEAAPFQARSAEDRVAVSGAERDAQTKDTPVADVVAEVAESCDANNPEESKIASITEASARLVGPNIPWDTSTFGGRWLRYRDRAIRAGRWEHHRHSKYAEIDLAFPYNPEMTWAEMARKNQLLEQYYKHTIFPTKQRNTFSRRFATVSPTTEVNERAPSSGGGQPAASQNQTKSQKSSHHYSVSAENTAQGGSCSFVCSSSAQIDPLPDKPPSSDSHPSHATISESAPTTPPGGSRSPKLDFLRTKRLAFFSKLTTPSKNKGDTDVQFYSKPAIASEAPELVDEQIQNPLPRRPGLAEEVSFGGDSRHDMEAKGHPKEGANQSYHAGNELSLPALATDESQGTDNSSLQVPATLYPDVDSSRRPRDEDPNVMPIPRYLGFRFDPQQLADLATIAKGGNGCARGGAQFRIEEEEYEWGGGGMMGWKTSSGPQLAGASGGHPPYEKAGRGDEEGLLEELPRGLD